MKITTEHALSLIQNLFRNDRALELGDFLVSDTGGSKEKPRVLPVVVDPMTFWRLVQMLYYTTKPQETRGCPLSHVFTRLKIHYHIFMIVHLFSAGQVILTTLGSKNYRKKPVE